MTERIAVGDRVEWTQFGEWLGKPFARTFVGTVIEIRNWGQGDVATVEDDDRRLLPKLLLVSELTRIDSAADRETMRRDMERELYRRVDAEDREGV